MDKVRMRDLVRCTGQHLARELHELFRNPPNSQALLDYCHRVKFLLKKLRKVLGWARTYSVAYSRLQSFQKFIEDRRRAFKDVLGVLAGIHTNQLYSLRTPPFSLEIASNVLCKGEYLGFPSVGRSQVTQKVPLAKLNKFIKHKLLLTEVPEGLSIE